MQIVQGNTPLANQVLKYPYKGKDARKSIPDEYLTQYERTEIEEFEEIWFLAP